jgi:SPFH domain / Band 7 family
MSRHLIARSLTVSASSNRPTFRAVEGARSHSFRSFSYVFDGFGSQGGGSSWQWPVTKSNTVFNIVPQGHKYVVERFGKLHSIQDSGYFFAVPWVDRIAYVVDIRERAMDIPPQAAITRDNVSVEVSGNLFIKFQDPQAAAYGALNPLYSVTQVGCHGRWNVDREYNRVTVGSLKLEFVSTHSTHNLPCARLLEKWSSMRFCMAGRG